LAAPRFDALPVVAPAFRAPDFFAPAFVAFVALTACFAARFRLGGARMVPRHFGEPQRQR
jgi:hypothetical protein